jgi:cytochrome c oxidase cbb3-type subunit 1
MAIRPVNSLSHYTDWTIAHVHAGAMGWVAMITFGSFYAAVPWLWRRPQMYSPGLVEWHFWLALAGSVIYVIAMWNAGIMQGLMWRTYGESGTLTYSFLDTVVASRPYYIARGVGGLFFLAGALVGIYNIWMTARGAAEAESGAAAEVPVVQPSAAALRPGE